ncbi:hypothetical protein GO755_13915 [Spirosoma sp. HMF4905]|uniref:TMF family protein n=1 Tax=Spirosoma arboris TaxID=2682092 RepID=A0A7K1SBD2_9BACT|nr:hypothetical protein [Spirosoma arboris]MVM31133.1 hypothetical protein [Spirosoma arboris]
MKQCLYLFLILVSPHLLAQFPPTDYVANSSNAYSPGYYNALVGSQAGLNITIGSGNSILGYDAGRNTTTGNYNSYVGYSAGFVNSTGNFNSYLGAYSGSLNTSGFNNSFVGSYAGAMIKTGYANTAVGMNALYNNNTGNNNVMIGDSAGFYNTVSGNIFVGSKAGYINTIGSQNTFIGYQAGFNVTASANTFVGYQAGRSVTTGNNNIIIGPNSGTAVTDGSENVLMGYNSQAEDGLYNATAIGAGSRVAISNAFILGNNANVGIGTSAPKSRLEVVSEASGTSGIRLTNLTSQHRTAQTTDQFLTVNEHGDIIKARYQLRINNANEWSDKVFSAAYQLRPLGSVADYIDQHGHLPGVPSADEVVNQGVDLVKMNATLLEKVEELTLYSIQQQKEIDQLKQLVRQLVEKK